ncbi:GNAT family N-acetyltransferase [Brevundimonas sp.]|uniref:GNAT family N-acetyltransferase n=1 Tax=Brevundimonas sp. TaxID=1871086 RepID=UPI002ABB4905|nr:GNAT family N-acetyltransferase [Brevundimonas sp.]MDZ4362675.1 GNAT family N-acetyltransferase [Brevundimonas sp.]
MLITDRLVLRRAVIGDLKDMHGVLSDARATRYWSTPPHDTIEQTQVWLDGMIASPPEVSEDFVVTLDGRVVGKAGFYRLPEIGYILHPDVWGHGIGYEACRAVIDHVFAIRATIDHLIADVDPENLQSINLLTRLGFRRTGRRARTIQVGGVWCDSVYFRLDRA